MAYAVVSDVTARLGRPATDDEQTLITTRLADAERLILKRIPDLADQLAADPPTIDQDDVVQVEAEAVLRVVRNPNGYVSETDGEYTYQLGQSSEPAVLEILPSEWELILGSKTTGMIQIVPNLHPVPCWGGWLYEGFQ